MRVLIAVSCLLAVASAGYAGGYGGYHIPVIGPHGVPLDEPAVAHAKAEHYAAYAEAASRAGAGGHYGHGIVGQAVAAPGHYAPATKWYGPIHVPVIGPHGVPVDEPAVQHARAQHAAALAGASHGSGGYDGGYDGSYDGSYDGGYDGGYGGHGAYAVGPAVPHDTPEVAAAKAAHFQAHAEAASHGGYHHYRRRRGIYGGYHGPLPVIGHDGVPQDEPAVAAAKAHHFAAFNEAAQRNAGHGYAPQQVHGAPAQYEPVQRPWHGPIHIPVLNQNGVPVEPHEVQAARANHAAAFADAAARAGSSGYAQHPHW